LRAKTPTSAFSCSAGASARRALNWNTHGASTVSRLWSCEQRRKLLQQYLQFSPVQPGHDRFKATLTICALHSLLTQCSELLKYTQVNSLKDLQETLTDIPNCLGLTTSVIVENTFPEPLTGAGLLEHLRDALSHPAPDADFRFRPTGFTTTGDGDTIRGYIFTNSPWIKADARSAFGEFLPCRTERAAESVIRGFCRHDCKDFALEVLRLQDGRFDVGRGGQPYVPLLVARLSLDVLINMTLVLAESLSRHAAPVLR
jgi:hypothetical protein